MGVIIRNRKVRAQSAEQASAPAPAVKKPHRLRPTFVYENTFDTDVLGDRLLELTRLTVWKGLANIAFDWAVVALTIWAVYAISAVEPRAFWPLWFVAIFVVGGRMHALLIMMHDGSHQRLLPNRVWNDRVANWFGAFTAFVSVEAYRKEHLIHHFFVNSDKDPNWITKKDDPEWVFPTSKGALAWIFLKEFLGFGLLRIVRYVASYGKQAKKEAERRDDAKGRMWERLAYYIVIAAAITLVGGWTTWLLFWAVPLFFILPAILRARILAEHHGLPRTNDLTHSRNYHVTLLERFFIAPHDIHLHVVHHMFPAIPCYNVAKAHALLLEIPEYRTGAAETDGIISPWRLSVLQDLTAKEATKALTA